MATETFDEVSPVAALRVLGDIAWMALRCVRLISKFENRLNEVEEAAWLLGRTRRRFSLPPDYSIDVEKSLNKKRFEILTKMSDEDTVRFLVETLQPLAYEYILLRDNFEVGLYEDAARILIASGFPVTAATKPNNIT